MVCPCAPKLRRCTIGDKSVTEGARCQFHSQRTISPPKRTLQLHDRLEKQVTRRRRSFQQSTETPTVTLSKKEKQKNPADPVPTQHEVPSPAHSAGKNPKKKRRKHDVNENIKLR